MSWSSGKDSAMALDTVRHQPDLLVEGLLVTVNADADRVAMHAVRRSLLEAQAARLGLPLEVVEIPFPCPNDVYEARMAVAIAGALELGVEHVVFGDLFLEDDERFLADLPEGADPCGERGEFHTFVWDAPGFSAPVDIEVGEVTERDGFVFC